MSRIVTKGARNLADKLNAKAANIEHQWNQGKMVYLQLDQSDDLINDINKAADYLRSLANIVDGNWTEEKNKAMTHDTIVYRMMNSLTQEEFVILAFKYSLLCVDPTVLDTNTYLIPYRGGITIISRYSDGEITTLKISDAIADAIISNHEGVS